MGYIEYADKGFEQAVRNALNKLDGELTSEDLLKIKGVLITDKYQTGFNVPWQSDAVAFNMKFPDIFFNIGDSENGKWITDLKYFSHIKTLHIYVRTETLSFLNTFISLNELYVKNSNELDWGFLESLTNLRFLSVWHSKFRNLMPLAVLGKKQSETFESERKLVEKGNSVNLFNTNLLNYLYLVECGITNIQPLAECKYISDLTLSHNEISDIKPLSNLDGLYYLTLRWNKIEDITPLRSLKFLYYLNLRHNHIRDISMLKKYTTNNLTHLYLGYNEITDLSPLKSLNINRTDVLV